LLDTLPPIESAFNQRLVTQLLGGIYFTTLGQYNVGYFVDPKVQPAYNRFQQALAKAGDTIKQANTERVNNWKGIIPDYVAANWAYEYLLPQNIPQSINI
jgi:arachidonate 15-lipoxygenase